MWRLLLIWVFLVAVLGCGVIPKHVRKPEIHNPFPQLSRVAVVQFANATTDDTAVDGVQFALAYHNELQSIPGFEVMPPDVVAAKIQDLGMTSSDLGDPVKRRFLMKELDVDALVLGIVTDYTPYYPPRVSMRVEWYSRNPCYHPIPKGFGLPWGTSDEEDIPNRLVYESEMELAKKQLKTQTPIAPKEPQPLLRSIPANFQQTAANESENTAPLTLPSNAAQRVDQTAAGLPADWPDPRGFIPLAPSAKRPVCRVSNKPVMTHTQIYRASDSKFIKSLRNYSLFKEIDRPEGVMPYLQRSEEFIRFCCHRHIAEMLTARGGGGKSEVVWRWPTIR